MIAGKNSKPAKSHPFSRAPKDPFQRLYLKAFFVYALFLALLTLWPFEFGFFHKNRVTWVQDTNGVIFDGGQIISPGPAKVLYDKIRSGSGLSIEIWLSSPIENQVGPARIISFSADPHQRNFTIAQERDKLVVRLRTINTDPNGIYPHAELSGIFSSSDIKHIVATYDYKKKCIFVDAQCRLCQPMPLGRFDNWDPTFPLVFGNEATGNRPWTGRIYYAAIYDHSISKQDIKEHYSTGWRKHGCKADEPQPPEDGLVARYCFDARKGTTVHDSSAHPYPLDLKIPFVLNRKGQEFLAIPGASAFMKRNIIGDSVLNLLAFVPFGFLLHALLRNRFGESQTIAVAVIILGGMFTTGIESLQYYLPTRSSSMLDVINNLSGTTAGVFGDRYFSAYLKRG
jgi:VanZ family protein